MKAQEALVDLTGHGNLRIMHRTRMIAKDVLEIISRGAVVPLGVYRDYEFLLFYSPPDQETKIAVTGSNRSALVSVWNSDFDLPDGIKKANRKRDSEARWLLQAYIFEKSRQQSQLLPRKQRRALVKIDVEQDSKLAYRHEHGEVAFPVDQPYKKVVETILPQVKAIAEIVEANRYRVAGKIRYAICLLDPETQLSLHVRFVSHKDFVSENETAPV